MESMSAAEMVQELVQAAETPDHKKLKHLTEEFIREFVSLGIKYNKMVEALVKQVEGWYPPDRVDRRELEKATKKLLAETWGTDPGLDVLAKILARGDYIT